MAEVPARLRTGTREPDQVFGPSELLYVRCRVNEVAEGRLAFEAIKFPDWSTNRQKYSEPFDVLLPNYDGWGVACFAVADIPNSLQIENSKVYHFAAVHDPTADNYAHTEVRTEKDGVFNRNLKVPASIKKQFRMELSKRTAILKEPSESSRAGD